MNEWVTLIWCPYNCQSWIIFSNFMRLHHPVHFYELGCFVLSRIFAFFVNQQMQKLTPFVLQKKPVPINAACIENHFYQNAALIRPNWNTIINLTAYFGVKKYFDLVSSLTINHQQWLWIHNSQERIRWTDARFYQSNHGVDDSTASAISIIIPHYFLPFRVGSNSRVINISLIIKGLYRRVEFRLRLYHVFRL